MARAHLRRRSHTTTETPPIPPISATTHSFNIHIIYFFPESSGFTPKTNGRPTDLLELADAMDRRPGIHPRDPRGYRGAGFVVYVSSDAVEWCGATAYARQKAQVESYIQAIDGAVIRPTRVTPALVGDLARLMVDVGLNRKQGVHRWKP